jgi:hypothetical protein
MIGIAMLFLTVGVAATAGVLLVLARLKRRSLASVCARLAIGLAVWSAAYATALVSTSLASTPRILGLNEHKKFCGFYLDCHRQVAVVAVDSAPALGAGATLVGARGSFLVLTLQISSDAVRAPMRFAGLDVALRDSRGRAFARDAAAERAAAGNSRDVFAGTWAPGEARSITLVFDVPSDATGLTLLVKALEPVDQLIEFFLIGDEDSVLHPPTVFRVAR